MLTVLMATYNGAQKLPDALDAYQGLETPAGGWRLIIVDNGSTDATKDIIATFASLLPITYRYEPKKGKNIALNTALPSVFGDLVVFTDDDVLPRADWLRQLRRVADAQSAYAMFAGTIRPKWERPPEPWILNWVPLSPTYAVLDPDQDGACDPRLVFGANMTVRSEVFEKGYRFDESVGPKSGRYRRYMGGETEFTVRLAKAGYQAWHCKDAVVYHMIRAEQMTRPWVLRRAVYFGRGEYRLETRDKEDSLASLLWPARPLPFQLLAQRLRLHYARWAGDDARRFKAQWRWNVLVGRAQEAWLALRKKGFPGPLGQHDPAVLDRTPALREDDAAP